MIITLYHGTNSLFDVIDINKSENYRDFGKGFYTTTIAAQAESWARSKKLRNGSNTAYVYVYTIELSDELAVKRFDGLSEDWLEMIKINRRNGGIQHNYDVVIGPVANDDTRVTVARYMQGVYTVEEALKRLAYSKANDQVTFHTQCAIDKLHLTRRYTVE